MLLLTNQRRRVGQTAAAIRVMLFAVSKQHRATNSAFRAVSTIAAAQNHVFNHLNAPVNSSLLRPHPSFGRSFPSFLSKIEPAARVVNDGVMTTITPARSARSYSSPTTEKRDPRPTIYRSARRRRFWRFLTIAALICAPFLIDSYLEKVEQYFEQKKQQQQQQQQEEESSNIADINALRRAFQIGFLGFAYRAHFIVSLAFVFMTLGSGELKGLYQYFRGLILHEPAQSLYSQIITSLYGPSPPTSITTTTTTTTTTSATTDATNAAATKQQHQSANNNNNSDRQPQQQQEQVAVQTISSKEKGLLIASCMWYELAGSLLIVYAVASLLTSHIIINTEETNNNNNNNHNNK